MDLMRLVCYEPSHEELALSFDDVKDFTRKIHLELEQKYEHELFKFMRDNRVTVIYAVNSLNYNSKKGCWELFYRFYKLDDRFDAQKDSEKLTAQVELLDFSRAARMSDEEFEINCRPMISKGSNVEIVREWRNVVRG